MDTDSPLSQREEKLLEEVMVTRRVIEISKMLLGILTVRCGGQVSIKRDEIEFYEKNYELTENIQASDLTLDISFKATLK
jgi:hypothetical protein